MYSLKLQNVVWLEAINHIAEHDAHLDCYDLWH